MRMRRAVAHRLEALILRVLIGGLGLLPLDFASALGGAVARTLGPLVPVSRVARANLRRAFPDLPEAELRRHVRDMWDNLGRTFAEYPHLAQIMRERVQVVGADHIAALRDDGQPGIFYSGHLANWEIAPLTAAQHGLPLVTIYRAANNPIVDRLVQGLRYRALDGRPVGTMLPKGAKGAREALRHLAEGAHLGFLIDQKMNDGIAAPFFGHPAMTAPALAQLALRARCPVVAAAPERLTGARFRITILPPVQFAETGDRQADVLAAMTAVNRQIEAFIRARPAQWLWLHKRWPK